MGHEVIGAIVTALVLTAFVASLSNRSQLNSVLSTSFSGIRGLQTGISGAL